MPAVAWMRPVSGPVISVHPIYYLPLPTYIPGKPASHTLILSQQHVSTYHSGVGSTTPATSRPHVSHDPHLRTMATRKLQKPGKGAATRKGFFVTKKLALFNHIMIHLYLRLMTSSEFFYLLLLTRSVWGDTPEWGIVDDVLMGWRLSFFS